MKRWSELKSDRDYVIIGWDEIGPYGVSTVWLGIDHGFLPNGLPVVYETLVMSDEGYADSAGSRYRTEDEAIQGHEMWVREYRAKWNAFEALVKCPIIVG